MGGGALRWRCVAIQHGSKAWLRHLPRGQQVCMANTNQPHTRKQALVHKQVNSQDSLVQDHGWPLQAQAPGDDIHALRQAHGPQHFGAEHAAVAHLDPLAQLLRVAAGEGVGQDRRSALACR